MTASQHAEMTLTGRGPSEVPVLVVEGVLHRRVPDPARAVVGHVAQASLAAAAVIAASMSRRARPAPAVVLTGLVLVGADAALATAVGVGESPWRWDPRGLATDVLHKTVLAAVARRLAL